MDFSKLCKNETLWNFEGIWNTTDPDFTDCFHYTILVWVPCGFLWLMSPLQFYMILKSRNSCIPWSGLNIGKIILDLILIGISTSWAIYSTTKFFSSPENQPFSHVLAAIIRTFSLVLALVFVHFERKKGLQSSFILFWFWTFLALCGAFTYRTIVMYAFENDSPLDQLDFVYELVYYHLVICMVVLTSISDESPGYNKLEEDAVGSPSPELHSSYLSRMTYAWFDKIIFMGYKKGLEKKDLWDLNYSERSKVVVPVYNKQWLKESRKTSNINQSGGNEIYGDEVRLISGGNVNKTYQPSILKVAWKCFGTTFVFGAVLLLISDLLVFVAPLLLQLLIQFISDKNAPSWHGYLFAFAMFVFSLAEIFVLAQHFHWMFLIGMRVRASVISAIYRKALRISNRAKKSSTVGEIVNLMSVDAQRFMDLIPYINMLWSSPMQIVIALYLLWIELGPSALAGLAVMILMIPINGIMANKINKLQEVQMQKKDERVKMMNEILNGIKVLKLYAWETSFEAQVNAIRAEELVVLKKAAFLHAAGVFIWTFSPFIIGFATFATYILSSSEHNLDPVKAFYSLSIFQLLEIPMDLIPWLTAEVIQAYVSLKRVNKFMRQDELDPECVQHNGYADEMVTVRNGAFSWGEDGSPTLSDINLHVRDGELVAIVGTVGAGKSSLLSAVLGEMERVRGIVETKGDIAYVAQLAWIRNVSLKNNVLFGKPLDRDKYEHVIEACALLPDFDMLPGRDETEIGEKGINLSGGQKQRVSLARAVYSDADLYLLDDPLSAVDAHVGKHIFEQVIGPTGLLKKKTRIFVTHSITYLPKVDKIVVLDNGRVTETGTYQELLDKKGAFSNFIMTYLIKEAKESEEGLSAELEKIKDEFLTRVPSPELKRQFSQQMATSLSEKSDIGSLVGSVGSGGRIRTYSGDEVREDSPQPSSSLEKRRGTLLRERKISSVSNGVASAARDSNMKVTGNLIKEEEAETGSVKTSVYWYYIRALGFMMTFVTIFFYVIGQTCSIGSNIWLSQWSDDGFLNNTADHPSRNTRLSVYGLIGFGQALAVLVAALSLAVGSIKACRLMHSRLLSNILRSPMSFFDTTPIGRIVNRFAKDVDVIDETIPGTFQSWLVCLMHVVATLIVIAISTPVFIAIILPVFIPYYFIQKVYVATSRQLKRLESISRSPIYSHFSETLNGAMTIRAYKKQNQFITDSETNVDDNQKCAYPSIIANRWLSIRLKFVGNLIVLTSAVLAVYNRDTLMPGLAGLSISYALSVTMSLNWMVRMSSELETNIVAVERIKEYTETPTEAPKKTDKNLGTDWPKKGNVKFVGYTTRYREGLDLVLKGITCDIRQGEKVGIVGRTGAGKSSLTLALFRIIEAVSGSIMIDGVDIAEIGLDDLRSRLTIIPQDPVLFSGSMRMNLDPFKQYSDDQVWKSLEQAHLKNFISSLTLGLQHEITEGGENLSVGQRQLVCLARALLRKTNILILDEATAAVDLETDELIQKTIRVEFADCTVLTIAHRLNTIMDSTRVMVLDQGAIKEFAPPDTLLQNKKSIFFGMAKDAGLVT